MPIFLSILHELNLTESFFNLKFEIHTTSAVLFELYAGQKEILQTYQSAGRLVIHNLEEKDFMAIYRENYPKSLSETDKSVLHIANKINACVLSSDKALRNYAQNKEIEYHGMIWIFDKLVETAILNPKEAGIKLNQLVRINFFFRNNRKLMQEIEKRLKLWS